jgi:hypothetical protein
MRKPEIPPELLWYVAPFYDCRLGSLRMAAARPDEQTAMFVS